MNLASLVDQARSFASKVAQDPARYASALKSGLDAIDDAREVFAALSSHANSAAGAVPPTPSPLAPAAEPPLVRELDAWAAIAETQEADAQVLAEIERDQHALTAQEVDDALVTIVKIVGLVGKAL